MRVPEELVRSNGEGQLADWIKCRHGHEIHQHNGGLAVNLTEKAFRKLSRRVVKEQIKGKNENLLCASDYSIEYEDDEESNSNSSNNNDNLSNSSTLKKPKGWQPKAKEIQMTVFSVLSECQKMYSRFHIAEIFKLFKDAGITDDVLEDLTEKGLENIGVLNYGDRLRIMKVLKKIAKAKHKYSDGDESEAPKQYQTQQQKARVVRVHAVADSATAADEVVEEEEKEEEEEEKEEEEEDEKDNLQGIDYQSDMYGNICLNGVVAIILDASGSMGGSKVERVKKETIELLQGVPNGVTFALFSYGDEMRTWMSGSVGTIPGDREDAIEWVTNAYIADGGTEDAMPECMVNAMCIEKLGQILLLCDGGTVNQYLGSMEPSVPVNATFLSPGDDDCIPGLQNISARTGGAYNSFACGNSADSSGC